MKKSAGILMYRWKGKHAEFFLVHPGGPFWKNKEAGAWSIPKGEFTDEEPLTAAVREFEEETGQAVTGPFIHLTPIRQKSGKWVHAFAVEGDMDPAGIRSNSYMQEWPYKSGKFHSFPEVDKAGWFELEEARKLINTSQAQLLEELAAVLKNKT